MKYDSMYICGKRQLTVNASSFFLEGFSKTWHVMLANFTCVVGELHVCRWKS